MNRIIESDGSIRDDAARQPRDAAAPRAVVRLLRSGLLSPAREERVLKLHGGTVEAHVARTKSDE